MKYPSLLSFPQCTTYDLLEKGIEVHIVADAVSSRRYLCILYFVLLYSIVSPTLNIDLFLCVSGIGLYVFLLLCLPTQPDRPLVCSVPTEAERGVPHHHWGCSAAAGSRRQTPKLQGGACSSCTLLLPWVTFVCFMPDKLIFFIDRSRGFWLTRPLTPASSPSSALCSSTISCDSVPKILYRISLQHTDKVLQ